MIIWSIGGQTNQHKQENACLTREVNSLEMLNHDSPSKTVKSRIEGIHLSYKRSWICWQTNWPFQFLYPTENYHPKEVQSHKFKKAKLNLRFQSEDIIFTFYQTLRNKAPKYNILLHPIQKSQEKQISASLSRTIVLATKAMATVLHKKLTSINYFTSFTTAQTYILVAANHSDGFKLLYCILEIIHPKVRAEKRSIDKTVEVTKYCNIPDDSIYTFITRYQNYLVYEEIIPQKGRTTRRKNACLSFRR